MHQPPFVQVFGRRNDEAIHALWRCALAPMSIHEVTAVHNRTRCRPRATIFAIGWPGNDQHIGEVCDPREKLRQALIKMGYCLGKRSQFRAEFAWHKCAANSLR